MSGGRPSVGFVNVTLACALSLSHEHLALGVRILDAYAVPRSFHPLRSGSSGRAAMLQLLESTARHLDLIETTRRVNQKSGKISKTAKPSRLSKSNDPGAYFRIRPRQNPFDLGVRHDALLRECTRRHRVLASHGSVAMLVPSHQAHGARSPR